MKLPKSFLYKHIKCIYIFRCFYTLQIYFHNFYTCNYSDCVGLLALPKLGGPTLITVPEHILHTQMEQWSCCWCFYIVPLSLCMLCRYYIKPSHVDRFLPEDLCVQVDKKVLNVGLSSCILHILESVHFSTVVVAR